MKNDSIAALLANAVRGDNPMGGPQLYNNDMREPPPLGMPPQAMLPPGFQMQPDPNAGPMLPAMPPVEYRRAPLFHRLNPGPRNNWRDMEL